MGTGAGMGPSPVSKRHNFLFVHRDDVSFNCEDNNCRTPLHIAAQHGCSAVVYRMLKNKAFNKSAQDIEGKTALYLAAENNHEKVLEVSTINSLYLKH